MAPRVTIIIEKDGGGLEQYYHAADEMLQEYYDRSPTALNGVHVTEQDKGDQAYYNALAQAALEAEKQGHW